MRLNLVIVDEDRDYVESLANYLMSDYSKRFQVSSFSSRSFLLEFLSYADKEVDILLIGPDLHSSSIPCDKVKCVIFLCSGGPYEKVQGIAEAAKYQPADKLVSSILNVFSEKSDHEVVLNDGQKRTKVIAVYSPVGGAGKTTVALSCCLQCAALGMTVFYLNAEDISSTECFFPCDGKQNLSNLFFFIKEKNKNLRLKIEAARCIDSHNIHYFCPPDSFTELQEIEPDELTQLIRQLRSMNHYDVVYIDMGTGLDEQNMAVLKECDHIVLVSAQDMLSSRKVKLLQKELERRLQKENINLWEKMLPVLNKYTSVSRDASDESMEGAGEIAGRLPLVSQEQTVQALENMSNPNHEFGREIYRITSKLLHLREAEV